MIESDIYVKVNPCVTTGADGHVDR